MKMNYEYTSQNMITFWGQADGQFFAMDNYGDGVWLTAPYDTDWSYDQFVAHGLVDMTGQEKIDILHQIADIVPANDHRTRYLIQNAILIILDEMEECGEAVYMTVWDCYGDPVDMLFTETVLRAWFEERVLPMLQADPDLQEVDFENWIENCDPDQVDGLLEFSESFHRA